MVTNTNLRIKASADVSKLATIPGVTTAAAAKNFMSNVVIADIVAVNGQPAKGVFFRERRTISLNPSAAPGQGHRGRGSDLFRL